MITNAGDTARRGERGATALIVAVFLVALLGMGAYVIDLGALYEERRDLQNGADAAALALAADCIVDDICSSTGAQPEAQRIAALNSNDGKARVAETDINFDLTNQTVTVMVHTLDASDNDDEIDFVLAPAIGSDGAAVQAEATAVWGAPSAAASIPITISSCEWDDATSGGTVFGVYTLIYLHGSGSDPTPCEFGPGQDVDGDGSRNEGGFGFLQTAVDCTAEILAGGYVAGTTGTGNPSHLGCEPGDILGKTLLIPIFDDIPDLSNPCGGPIGEACYHVYGFAAFHVRDLDMNGNEWRDQPNICPSSDRCIGGEFIEFFTLDQVGTIGGPNPDLGLSAVGLSG